MARPGRAGCVCGLSSGDCPRRDQSNGSRFALSLAGQFEKLRFRVDFGSLYPHPRGASDRMRMLRGGRRLANRLGNSDEHVSGSVELMTLSARRPYARARLVPATSATQPAADGYRHDGGSREAQSCRAETTSYPLGRRFLGPGSAAMWPRSRATPDRRATAVLTARLTGGALCAAARIGRVGELAGRLVPGSVSQRRTPLHTTGRPGERDCGLGRVG